MSVAVLSSSACTGVLRLPHLSSSFSLAVVAETAALIAPAEIAEGSARTRAVLGSGEAASLSKWWICLLEFSGVALEMSGVVESLGVSLERSGAAGGGGARS